MNRVTMQLGVANRQHCGSMQRPNSVDVFISEFQVGAEPPLAWRR